MTGLQTTVAFSDEEILDSFMEETRGTGDGSILLQTVFNDLARGLDVGFMDGQPAPNTGDGKVTGPEGTWLRGAKSWEDDYSEDSRP